MKKLALLILVLGLLVGVRYVSSTIRYGCADVPLVNVPGEDDCPPPFMLAGKIGWFVTGGSLLPLWNRDATAVQDISWNIEKADPSITSEDDFRFYEQKIAADVTFKDGNTRRFELGTAYGCVGETKNEIRDRKRFLGTVDCYFALTGTNFTAFNVNERFRIERYDESAQDGSVKTQVLVDLE